MKNKIKAICFDMWGTLCSGGKGTEWKILQQKLAADSIEPKLFRNRGEEIFFTNNLTIKNGLLQLTESLNIKSNKKTFNSALRFWKSLARKSQPFPETAFVLKKLAESGLRLFVISNTDSEPFYFKMKEIAQNKYFEKFFLSSELGLLKPDVRIFQTVQKYIAFAKDQILMVDDSLYHGVLPARKFGWKALWLARDREGKDKYKINDLKGIFNFL